MAKNPDKLRKNKRRDKYEINGHISGSGKPKKRLLPQHAKAIAERTGMSAYHCFCGAWHVGRTVDQLKEDGWKKGGRR